MDIGGDPARLERYGEETRYSIGQVATGTRRYADALHAYHRAQPNDLGFALPDRSGSTDVLREQLTAANRLPPAFAFALRQVDDLGLAPDATQAFVTARLLSGSEAEAARRALELLGSPFVEAPWNAFGFVGASMDAYDVALMAPFLRSAARTYHSEVARLAHLGEGAQLRAFLRWQEEVSGTVGVERAARRIPELRDYAKQLRAEEWSRLSRARRLLRIGGRVLIPVGILLDGYTLLAPGDTSGVERGFAAAGLYAGVVAGLVVFTTVALSPVILVTAAVAGVAAAGYALWQSREDLVAAARWVWEQGGRAVSWVGEQTTALWGEAVELGGRAWDRTTSTASEAWDWTTSTASEAWDRTTSTASEAWDRTTSTASEAWDWTTSTASDARDWAEERISGVADAAGDAWDGLTGRAGGALETVGGWLPGR